MNTHEMYKAAFRERQAGNAVQAEILCRRILAVQPNHPHALNMLGMLAYQARRVDMAVEMISRATQLAPDHAEFQFNLGLTLAALGQGEKAVMAYERCVALEPAAVQAICNLGAALHQLGRNQEAIAAYRKVIELQPNYADAHNNLGIALRSGDVLDAAIACYRQALVIKPTDPVAHNNLANALYASGDVDGAVAACSAGIAQQPEFAQLRWTLSLLLLVRENYEQGWPEHEWRLKLRTARIVNTAKPRWDGGDLTGKLIYLHSEQGFGDTIQFIRYIPEVLRRGGKIVLGCQRELVWLLGRIEGISQTMNRDEPMPEFDVHCPLPSLPYVMKTDATNLPAKVPYLMPDPSAVARWRERIGPETRLKIGLAWAGRVHPDPKRAMPLAALAPLAQVPNVRLFSLQKGDAGNQVAAAPMELTDWTADIFDFGDTASLIANMDLVISIDTAVAHLAGAMGHRVWTLLPFAPDWRWLLGRADSVWYPTMRLFRQPRINDWNSVVATLVEELASRAAC